MRLYRLSQQWPTVDIKRPIDWPKYLCCKKAAGIERKISRITVFALRFPHRFTFLKNPLFVNGYSINQTTE